MVRVALLVAVAAVAVLAALAAPASASTSGASTKRNKFIVTYSIVPDPLHLFSFYTMPRTTSEATRDGFAAAAHRDEDNTDVWCRGSDYRVCVLYDARGSVAGMQVAVKVDEIEKSSPFTNLVSVPEWARQTFLGEDVFTTTTFFVHKDILLRGGRTLKEEDDTAPDGLYILQTDSIGANEVNRLHVSNEQADALAAGFTEQSCFIGMGKHYFQGLRKDGKCEGSRPYFLLYGPKTQKLNGLGFTVYGKTSQGRGWFETPPALAAKQIAPNSPDCMTDWIHKHGIFTLHVFFIEKPYFTWC